VSVFEAAKNVRREDGAFNADAGIGHARELATRQVRTRGAEGSRLNKQDLVFKTVYRKMSWLEGVSL
jgi:hypothetical protein